jgi:hypothetical protein
MKNLILVAFTLICFDIKAQNVPPNAEPGKCYGRCMIDSTKMFSQWEEVVCSADVKPKLINKITKALKDKGYDVEGLTNKMDAQLRAILNKFQKDNKLPIGNLNIKTLEALGVSY